MKKWLLILVGVLVCWFVGTYHVHAAQCGDPLPSPADSSFDYNGYISDCIAKSNALQGQALTLSAALNVLNTQISLTQAKIAATQGQLNTLNNSIADLTQKIATLNLSLDDLTKLFVARVRESYIYGGDAPAEIIAEASGIPNLIENLTYVNVVRNHDRSLLVQLEESRLTYDAQKTELQKTQAEVEDLKTSLVREQNDLGSQIAAKNKLLADTKNSEAAYNNFANQARIQLAAFSNFVNSQGGAGPLTNQTSCDSWGCYYNQRDTAWGGQMIGLSDSSMAQYGCLVTSMAMVATHYGKSLKPSDIAGSSAPFWSNTAYMLLGSWSVSGVTMSRDQIGSSTSAIDGELSSNHPVVVGISLYGGSHFVVIKSKDGGDYIMNDPYVANGHDIKFTDHYPLSSITSVDRVAIQ